MKHTPVLLEEICQFVPENAKIIVDGTLGHGWHTEEFLKRFPDVKVVGIDIDQSILEKTKNNLENFRDRIIFERWSYVQIKDILEKNWIAEVDYILLDLWVNLEHFKDHSRGFSIKWEWNLDMRFDQSLEISAFDVVNKYPKDKLQKVFIDYADFTEKKALEIAENILSNRNQKEIKTTFDLKKTLNECWLWEKACTVIFQAIRIEVNWEINNLKLFLKNAPWLLKKGWRLAVISYHSTEDKEVKYTFKDLLETGDFVLFTKKVIMPNYKEIQKNKPSRSAKLRVLEKN